MHVTALNWCGVSVYSGGNARHNQCPAWVWRQVKVELEASNRLPLQKSEDRLEIPLLEIKELIFRIKDHLVYCAVLRFNEEFSCRGWMWRGQQRGLVPGNTLDYHLEAFELLLLIPITARIQAPSLQKYHDEILAGRIHLKNSLWIVILFSWHSICIFTTCSDCDSSILTVTLHYIKSAYILMRDLGIHKGSACSGRPIVGMLPL